MPDPPPPLGEPPLCGGVVGIGVLREVSPQVATVG